MSKFFVKTLFLFILAFFLMNWAMFSYAESSKQCSAIKLARYSKWSEASKCAASQKNPVLQKIVLWMKYIDKNSNSSFEEISQFIISNPGFPKKSTLIANAESKLGPNIDKNKVSKWFAKYPPSTSYGIKYYFQIYPNKNSQNTKFINLAKKTWINADFNKKERHEFLSNYSTYISQNDNIVKIDKLIWKGNKRIDPELLNFVSKDYRNLFNARLLLLRGNSNYDKIISKVPKQLIERSGLLYAQALWLHKKGRHAKAATIILRNHEVSKTSTDGWFNVITLTAVELIDKGQISTAYKVASSHRYKEPVNYVDGEWMAGKIAYFYLKDYEKAFKHFQNILNNSKFSISIAKGAYWTGVAAKKLGRKAIAQKYFAQAAKYPENLYGQLSITKLLNNDNIYQVNSLTPVSQSDLKWLKNNELARASYILSKANQYSNTRKFIKAAASSAKTATQRYLLSKFGHDVNVNAISVISGKESAHKGEFFPEYAYPILKKSYTTGTNEALVFSIIRQESEFNPIAKSHAGAMGLMQIIYPTAKDISRELNTRITKVSLLKNPDLNVKFGTHYILSLVKRYKGSYILAIAAYNAGPGNVDKWIKKYGDPRKSKSLDEAVNWIEKIPFYETRAYVQHVLSNLQIYKSILANKKNTKLKNIKINITKDVLR